MAQSISNSQNVKVNPQQMSSVCVCARDRKKNGNKPCQMILVVSFFRHIFSVSLILLILCRQRNARATDGFEYFFGWTVKSILINYYVTCTKHRSSTRGGEAEEVEKCTRFYIGTEWMNEWKKK